MTLLLVRILGKLGLFGPADYIQERQARAIAKRHFRSMVRFYRAFMGPGDLCFDVGANRGNRTAVFRELDCRVVAIEPQVACQSVLKNRFGHDRKVAIVPVALGGRKGEGRLLESDADTISSMSPGWIESVRKTERFPGHEWQREVTVAIDTLDDLIERYGQPTFCKIDVEGYEHEVLKGLSSPLKTISFEFTPEFIDAAVECVKHLMRLGDFTFNYSVGESMTLALEGWVDDKEMIAQLSALSSRNEFGDVYARSGTG